MAGLLSTFFEAQVKCQAAMRPAGLIPVLRAPHFRKVSVTISATLEDAAALATAAVAALSAQEAAIPRCGEGQEFMGRRNATPNQSNGVSPRPHGLTFFFHHSNLFLFSVFLRHLSEFGFLPRFSSSSPRSC